MTKHSATHATFVIERDLPHAPARVFAAYADPDKKSKWFGGPAEWSSEHTMDFRIGGKEISSGGPPGGTRHTMTGLYWDIVENERIVMAYDLHLDTTRISVSLGTTEIKPMAPVRSSFTLSKEFISTAMTTPVNARKAHANCWRNSSAF